MRTILITGGNRGIGRAVIERLARGGHRVIFTARTEDKAARTLEAVRASCPGADVDAREVELSSMASVRDFCLRLRDEDPKLEVILHSAGQLVAPPVRTLTEDGLEQTMAINTFAPHLMSRLLLPALTRPGRVFGLSSSLHRPDSRGPTVDFRLDDVMMSGHYQPDVAYKNSKLALIWVLYELERRFATQEVHADAICPGFVPRTAAGNVKSMWTRFLLRHVLSHMPFAVSLDDAADAITRLVTETPLDQPGGRFFHAGQLEEASPDARDAAKAARFFELAEELLAAHLVGE